MKYLKTYSKLNESKEHYVVIIEWEHGDADGYTVERYPFKTEDEMYEFLQFIYDLRNFIPNSGYQNLGHFSDSHYERERSWILKVDKKYNNKYSHLIPNDNRFKSGSGYSPSIESIWVEMDGNPLNIIWEKALKTNIINLPKIGDIIKTNTGQISYYGPTLWNKPDKYFYEYNDFAHWDEDFKCKHCDDGYIKSESSFEKCKVCKGKVQYTDLDIKVTDCRINLHEPYNKEKYKYDSRNDTEVLISSYLTHYDYSNFDYVFLCDFAGAYITTNIHGFDPNYDIKYHYAKYGTNDFYLVK